MQVKFIVNDKDLRYLIAEEVMRRYRVIDVIPQDVILGIKWDGEEDRFYAEIEGDFNERGLRNNADI